MNFRGVAGHHRKNRWIQKVAKNLEPEYVAVIFSRCNHIGDAELWANSCELCRRLGPCFVHGSYFAGLDATAAPAAAPIAPSSPSTFTSPEFEGTMYFVFCTRVLFKTSRPRIASARSLKKVSAAVETRRIASASALARVIRACASPSAFKISDCLKPSACKIWLCLMPSAS